MNKKVLIGVGVLAAAGLAYYLWKKNKDASTEGKEEKANAFGRFSTRGSMLTPRVAPIVATKAPNPTNVKGAWTCPSGWKVCLNDKVVSCCAGGFI